MTHYEGAYEIKYADGSSALGMRGLTADTDRANGTTLFCASTGRVDRHMDCIDVNSWRLDEWRQSPVILSNHNFDLVVGHGLSAEVVNGELMIRVKWDLESFRPEIRDVGRQHLAGVRRSCSVGFSAGQKTRRSALPKTHPAYGPDWTFETELGPYTHSGWYFEDCGLRELSSASVPANPDARQRDAALAGHHNGRKPETDEERCQRVLDVMKRLEDEENDRIIRAVLPGLQELAAIMRGGPPKRYLS